MLYQLSCFQSLIFRAFSTSDLLRNDVKTHLLFTQESDGMAAFKTTHFMSSTCVFYIVCWKKSKMVVCVL